MKIAGKNVFEIFYINFDLGSLEVAIIINHLQKYNKISKKFFPDFFSIYFKNMFLLHT